MKLVLEIKTEPVTQASIIVAVVAFSSGSVALIVIYSQSSLVCVCCVIALAIIVYVGYHTKKFTLLVLPLAVPVRVTVLVW